MTEILTCQRVLALTAFVGYMIHHMIRVNISIAIVEMVASNNSNNTLGPHYNWNEEEKNNILGYFFWGYVITQIPGGQLSEKFGTKVVLGTGILSASILTILTPLASNINYYCLLIVRFLLGVSLGIHFPSTPPLATKWIPPAEMSTFMSHTVASNLGAALTLPMCGYLMAYWGWPSVFYVTGTLSLIWNISWWFFVYDSPQQHPRISIEEKEKLKSEVKTIQQRGKRSTPWVKMMTSAPVWALIVANTTQSFTFFLAMIHLPTYMSEVLYFNIKQNGLLSSLPYLVRYFMSLGSALIADFIIKNQKLSRTTTRKTFTVFFFLGTSIAFAVQAFWGYSRLVSVIVFTSSFALMGFATPGFYANFVEVSPSFAGTINGIAQVPAALIGYVTTKIVALATRDNSGFEQWVYVFWSVVAVNFFAAIIFLIFASGEEQSWSVQKEDEEKEELNRVKQITA